MNNKYEELAQALLDKFLETNLTTNILVGSTDLVKWEDVIQDSESVYGVLNPAGTNSSKLNDSHIENNQVVESAKIIENEYFSLAMALPNNTKDDFSDALAKVNDAIINLISKPLEINGVKYIVSDNGRTSTNFLTIRGGNEIGVITQSLLLTKFDDLLAAGLTLVKITPNLSGQIERVFTGIFHYTYSWQKTFDSNVLGSTEMQKNFVQSLQETLVLDFNKIANDGLHSLFATNKTITYNITVFDGEDTLINNLEMHITSYVQDGITGGFITCKATFVSGVV